MYPFYQTLDEILSPDEADMATCSTENLLLSAAILYSGASPTKSLRLFRHMNCEVISIRTFFEHQKQYLHPTVRSMWLRNQSELLANLKREVSGRS